jgi:hypothetical protein
MLRMLGPLRQKQSLRAKACRYVGRHGSRRVRVVVLVTR